MNYTHLTEAERYQIKDCLQAGMTQKQIALAMNRSPATISRELRRNCGARGYRPKQAHELAWGRQGRNARRVEAEVWRAVEVALNKQHSPEQIAAQHRVSHESIYLYVYVNKAAGGSLWQHLRSQKKRRKRILSGHDRRGQIVNRRSLAERPAHIEARQHVGHWEADTVIGKNHQQAIVTLVERKSGFAKIMKVSRKSADLVSQAMIQLLEPFKAKVKTITFDNGKEFAFHQQIDAALQSISYFADPYSSWQRGSNENFNGLLRQYVPKKTDFSMISDNEIQRFENLLNHRPRKRLGFKTPAQVFYNSFKRVALRT